MEILHVNHLLDPVSGGGTAERTFQLCRFLNREPGVESSVLTFDIGDLKDIEGALKGSRIFKLRCLNRRYFLPLYQPFGIRAIVRQFDVVHLMGNWTFLNAVVALNCMLLGIPYVVCPAGALKSYGRS